jgi:ATP:corrinoid adenosyltransferase
MARMIPELDTEAIENRGERIVYETLIQLSEDYTVLYGYKYIQHHYEDLVREADFILVHPTHGFLVIEVKQGEAAYLNHEWHESKNGGYVPLHNNPLEQARSAMYHILHQYKKDHRNQDFPLRARYVVCFPECTRIAGRLPADLKPESLWLLPNLQHISELVNSLLETSEHIGNAEACRSLISILSPSFKLFATLNDQIEAFHLTAERILTEEQERVIMETYEDKRKLFLGAAGTGKTFIAIEKARRAVQEGKRVFLTCFNKHLVGLMRKQAGDLPITILNFHDYTKDVLKANHQWSPPNTEDKTQYFQYELAEQGIDYFNNASDDEKFDCILVDEGQDFREEWLLCLEEMLRGDGELYIFADPNQNIFGTTNDWRILKNYTISTHRLTQNMRNTEKINTWTFPFVEGYPARARIPGGMPVITKSWSEPHEQLRMIEKEIGRLVSQGIAPQHITILSPYKRDNGGLQGLDRIKDWPITDFNSGKPGIQYATIRSFKGLEADILLLIDIKPNSKACTPADVYVGASRVRYLLYVFHHVDWELPIRTHIP